MPDQLQTESNAAQAAAAEQFYSGALRRIRPLHGCSRSVAGCRGVVEIRPAPAIGFAFGCPIAYVNFHWLKRVISGFADRATGAATSNRGEGIVLRFLLRYVLMASAPMLY